MSKKIKPAICFFCGYNQSTGLSLAGNPICNICKRKYNLMSNSRDEEIKRIVKEDELRNGEFKKKEGLT